MRKTGFTAACVLLIASVSFAATPREVSVMDPSSTPTTSVAAHVGDPVSVILPLYPGMAEGWTYVSVDGALPPAKQDVVPRWLGPETNGAKFTFATARVAPGDHVIAFQSDPKTRVKVTIQLAR